MYRKYMHSSDKRANTSPVNEGLVSWAKGKYAEYKQRKADEKVEAEKRHEEKKKQEALELHKKRCVKGGKFHPPEAIKRGREIGKRLLSKPEFKELKSITKVPDWGSDFEDFYYEDLFVIQFKTAKSQAERDYDEKLVDKFADAVDAEFDKLDKTYRIYMEEEPDEEECYYIKISDEVASGRL